MKIKLKTLKGEAYDQEVTPDMIVGKVKEVAAASEYGTSAGWDAEGMKLIFQGKVLDNDKDLASCEQQPASLCCHPASSRSACPLLFASAHPAVARSPALSCARQTTSATATSWL